MASVLPDEHFTVGLNGDRVPVKATGRGPAVLAPLVEGRRVALLTDRNLERLHLEEELVAVRGDRLVLRPAVTALVSRQAAADRAASLICPGSSRRPRNRSSSNRSGR